MTQHILRTTPSGSELQPQLRQLASRKLQLKCSVCGPAMPFRSIMPPHRLTVGVSGHLRTMVSSPKPVWHARFSSVDRGPFDHLCSSLYLNVTTRPYIMLCCPTCCHLSAGSLLPCLAKPICQLLWGSGFMPQSQRHLDWSWLKTQYVICTCMYLRVDTCRTQFREVMALGVTHQLRVGHRMQQSWPDDARLNSTHI